MRIVRYLKSAPGRIARGFLGLGLIGVGARNQTATGLFLLMLGLVPLCTAIANICLLEDLLAAWGNRRDRAHQRT
ncbi:MAG: YgaP-like transmembrane domain [Vicinamibacterales bacterium]